MDCTRVDAIEYHKRIDYIGTLDKLVELGVVHTKDSEYVMATDPRVFSFDKQTWHEVDILGTQLGKDHTDRLVHEWKIRN